MNGWLAVGAVVASYDVHAGLTHRPTMSAAFRNGASRHPLAVTAAVGYLLAHLYGAVPRRYDPLALLGGNR